MSRKKMSNIKKIRSSIAVAPCGPGVYVFWTKGRKPLYVGKAKNLRRRLMQHFSDHGRRQDPRKQLVIERIHDVTWVEAPSERDAFLMENHEIKKLKPPFNVMLRDDKTFPYLRLTLSHPFPRLTLVRNVVSSKDLFLGPFRSGFLVDQIIDLCQKLFKIRSCTDSFFSLTQQPCLAYQMDRCRAPCVGYQTKKDYAVHIEHLKAFLLGRKRQLLGVLNAEMKILADQERYLQARVVRDQIRTIEAFFETQRSEFRGVEGHCDFWLVRRGQLGVLHVRYGVITGIRMGAPSDVSLGLSDEEVLVSGLTSYGATLMVPSVVFIPQGVGNPKTFKQLLGSHTSEVVSVRVPRRPAEIDLMAFLDSQLKIKSASIERKPWLPNQKNQVGQRGEQLRDFCRLRKTPKLLECIDVSHFQGEFMVGVVVVFDLEGPVPSAYRYYKIKCDKIDDPAAIREVVWRRFKKAGAGGGTLPDVLLVDGGRAQLNAASSAIVELGLSDTIVVLAMAKDRDRKYGGEKVFFAGGSKRSVILCPESPLYSFLCHLRDEAHRFSIQYQRRQFQKKVGKMSDVLKIEGVGPKRMRVVKMLLIEKGPEGILSATQPPSGFSGAVWQKVVDWAKKLEAVS